MRQQWHLDAMLRYIFMLATNCGLNGIHLSVTLRCYSLLITHRALLRSHLAQTSRTFWKKDRRRVYPKRIKARQNASKHVKRVKARKI